MYISLNTTDVWIGREELSISGFLEAIQRLLQCGDIVVIGSYEWECDLERWMCEKELKTPPKEQPFVDFFDINRDSYPNGRFFLIEHTGNGVLNALSKRIQGLCNTKTYIVDHLLGYRPGVPILPLFDYHDVGSFGDLYLSRHYHESQIEDFAKMLGTTLSNEPNPALELR